MLNNMCIRLVLLREELRFYFPQSFCFIAFQLEAFCYSYYLLMKTNVLF